MVNLPHDIAGLVERTYSRSIAAEELCDAGAAPEWVHALQSAEEELEKTKENKQLKAMAGLIKSLLKWGMGLTFTFFLGSVSIKSLNAAGLDSAGVKALKYDFDKSVPVVGGVISGTYEGLRAGAIVLKNAAGTVALLLLLLYFTAPGIRMLCSVISMRITAAICAVADDGRISAMLTAAADSCTYMFAVSAIAVLMNMLAVAAALLASGVG